ncbi:MAG: insulinase family protein [Myxococcota bacterium]
MLHASVPLAVAAAVALAGACGPKQQVVDDEAPPEETLATSKQSLRPNLVEEELSNGLTVYMIEDHSAPLVSYQTWFRVGSVNEHEAEPGEDHGITGLSHFFEHMMFRGTEKYPEFFDAIYALGGKLNAFTWLDETVYWESVPSRHLETVIEMEADRLEHMKVDFLNLEPEREVVKSERLLRTENSPEGLAEERLQARMFEEFPYHWGTIGWMRDLNAITVEEAQRYHEVYYAPNNAFILVVGDHDGEQTLAWLEEHYGHLEPKEIPEPDFPAEPEQEVERRDRVFKSVDPQIVLFAYRAPAVRERDYAVLEVLDRILAADKPSRLQQALVYADEPRLGRLSTALYPIRHPYMYTWTARLQPGMTTRALGEAVDAEVRDIADDGVSEEELQRAVAGLRSDVVRQNLSIRQKGMFIGFSLRATDDPFAFVDRLRTYGEITVDDVRRVAGEVLVPDERVWVPVVAPERLPRLVAAAAEATPSVPVQVAGLAKAAVALFLERREVRAQAQDLAMEEEALAKLEQRAQRATEGADEDKKEAIRAYLEDNEKGLVPRKEALEVSKAALAERRAALSEQTRELRAELEAVERARFDAERLPVGFLTSLADNVLRGRKLEVVDRPDDPALQPHWTAYGAAMAWILDDAGLDATAQSLREEVIAAVDADEAERSPEEAKLLEAAHALAWDTQVTGTELTDDTVRAERTGSPRGGRR